MTHDEVQILLPWCANRTLADDERKLVEAHLDSCTECKQGVEKLIRLGEASRAMDDEVPEVSSDLLEWTRQKIRQDQSRRARAKRWSVPVSLAASLVVGALAVTLLAPSKDLMADITYFSTGGNAYHAEIILRMFF